MAGIEPEEIALEPEGPNGGPCPTGAPPRYGGVKCELASPLEYIDIIPQVLEEASITNGAVYEKFDVLMERANDWLAKHTRKVAKTCELVNVHVHDPQWSQPEPEIPVTKETGKARSNFLKILRVWVVDRPRDWPPDEAQRLGCVCMLPTCLEPGSAFRQPRFAPYSEAIERLNAELKYSPLPGRILNVETQNFPFQTWSSTHDPNDMFWRKGGEECTFYLEYVRVYFQYGPPLNEELGCADFVPSFEGKQAMPFATVIDKARNWLSRQYTIHVVNVQSLDFKQNVSFAGKNKVVDTQCALSREQGGGTTHFMRYLRVYFTRQMPLPHEPYVPIEIHPVMLTSRTFAPYQIAEDGICWDAEYESMLLTLDRLSCFVQLAGARVFCVETIQVRMHTLDGEANSEKTVWKHVGAHPCSDMYVYRVYFDGEYEEPNPELLPPVPAMLKNGTCCDACVLL